MYSEYLNEFEEEIEDILTRLEMDSEENREALADLMEASAEEDDGGTTPPHVLRNDCGSQSGLIDWMLELVQDHMEYFS